MGSNPIGGYIGTTILVRHRGSRWLGRLHQLRARLHPARALVAVRHHSGIKRNTLSETISLKADVGVVSLQADNRLAQVAVGKDGAPLAFALRRHLGGPSAQVRQGGYGATAARLTPDQKVGSSNLSALIPTPLFCRPFGEGGRNRTMGVQEHAGGRYHWPRTG